MRYICAILVCANMLSPADADDCQELCRLLPDCRRSKHGSYCKKSHSNAFDGTCHHIFWSDSSRQEAGFYINSSSRDEIGKAPLKCSDATSLISGLSESEGSNDSRTTKSAAAPSDSGNSSPASFTDSATTSTSDPVITPVDPGTSTTTTTTVELSADTTSASADTTFTSDSETQSVDPDIDSDSSTSWVDPLLLDAPETWTDSTTPSDNASTIDILPETDEQGNLLAAKSNTISSQALIGVSSAAAAALGGLGYAGYMYGGPLTSGLLTGL